MQCKLQCICLLVPSPESGSESPLMMPENSAALYCAGEECFSDGQSAEMKPLVSSLLLEAASIYYPPATSEGDSTLRAELLLSDEKNCATHDANTTSPSVFTASDFSPKKSLFVKARKVRRKLQMEALEKMATLGVMQNGCSESSSNSLAPLKLRVPKCPAKGFKPQHVMSKSFRMAKELVGDSDLSSEQIPCLNGDLHSNYSVDAPRVFPRKVIDASGGDALGSDDLHSNRSVNAQRVFPQKDIDALSTDDGNHSFTYTSTESSRKDFQSGCDAIAVKQEGVMSSYVHTPLFTWFAGLLTRTLRSQWNILSHVLLSLMLAWYHSFLFALHPLSYMLHARAKATAAYKIKKLDSEKLGVKLQSRVQPNFALGARKLAFGSLTALYTLSMLTCLFVASFMLSFFIVKGFVYEPVQLHEYLFFDYTKQLPVASVDFTESMMYPHMGSMFRRLSSPARNFHATVYLTVPESDFNKELGIFQVTAELISATGQVLLSKTQPCMLRFRSTALQHVKAFLMAVPLLAGSYLETQTLAVSSLKWQEQRALSSAAVRVVLAPRAGRPLLTGLPELYEAGISLESELPWWARLIGNWRWTLSVWLGLALFIGAVVIILGLCNQFLVPDLSLVCSFISNGLGKRESYEVKAAYPKLQNFSGEPTLVREKNEAQNDFSRSDVTA